MQTKTRNSITEAIKIFVADKPALSKQFEKFETQPDDLEIFSAFTGSVHEMPTRSRRSKRS